MKKIYISIFLILFSSFIFCVLFNLKKVNNYSLKNRVYHDIYVCDSNKTKECIKANSTLQEKVCPSGYSKCGDKCCTNEGKTYCESPYTFDGNNCVAGAYVSVIYVCPSDSRWPNSNKITTDKDYKCDSKTALGVFDGVSCRKNYVLNGSGSTCNSNLAKCTKNKCITDTMKSATCKTDAKCIAQKKSGFSCSKGTLECKTGYAGTSEEISAESKPVKECRCKVKVQGTCKTYSYSYKLKTAEDCKGTAGANQAACAYCKYGNSGDGDNSCGSTKQVCCKTRSCISYNYTYTTEAPTCTNGGTISDNVTNNGYYRCRINVNMKTKNYEEITYPEATETMSCPNGGTYDSNTDTCSITAVKTCDEGGQLINNQCVYDYQTCPDNTIEVDGKCISTTQYQESEKKCEKLCAKCKKNNTDFDLTSCVNNVIQNGRITVNGRNYSVDYTTLEKAYNYCYVNNSCNMSSCNKENEALQKIPVNENDIKSCVWGKIDRVLSASSDSALNQLYNECTTSSCTKKCYSSSVSGENPSCDNKYDESQILEYEETTKEESSTSGYCNTNPRISKYGRLVKTKGNCNLFCTQKSKIALPTNILQNKNRSSYFEWPTREVGNHLRIETTNTCYIFTAFENASANSSCVFAEEDITSAMKADIDVDGIKLTPKFNNSKLEGEPVVNTNTLNPQSFKYTLITDYYLPESNNKVTVEKADKTLSKTLSYGVIQIAKNATLGQKDLKLTVENYGFNNQFGSIINNYTCHYNVVKQPVCGCEEKVCKGELTVREESYSDTKNKIKVKSYKDSSNEICNLEYTCINGNQNNNAIKCCVMSYYASKNWVYDVNLIDSNKLTQALNHCSSACNDIEQVIFRVISPTNPFPGRSGENRIPGSNWIGREAIAKSNDTSKTLYEIKLTKENIKNIRTYNSTHDYDDWTINNNGESSFLRNTSYINNFKYNSSNKTTIETSNNCPKVVTPPMPIITWSEDVAVKRKDDDDYKSLRLKGTITESTGKELNIESAKYCITTEEECEPTTEVTSNNNVILSPFFTTNTKSQRICAIVKDKSGSESSLTCSSLYKVNTSPELNITFSVSGTKENNWYKSLNVKATLKNDDINMEIINAKYCITTNESCTPNQTVSLNGSSVLISSFNSNKNKQRVCVTLRGSNGKTVTDCSDAYFIDITAPSKPTINNPSNQVCTPNNFSLTVGSNDEESGIAYYQYTYKSDATSTGTDGATSWVTYANSASNSFVTTLFSANRNQLVYIRACNKAGLCSTSNSTYIRKGVAKTSDTACYASLQAAVNASNSGTITLLKDTTENVTIASGKNLTLNMNGKTLTGSITNNGTLTINGSGYVASIDPVVNNGTLTISNGTFGISTTGSNTSVRNWGTTIINGGTFRAINPIINYGGMTTINNGTVQARDTALWLVGGNGIRMNSGSISTTANYTWNSSSSSWITIININISGESTYTWGNRTIDVDINWGGLSARIYVHGPTVTYCPTWTNNNGQDDLIWHTASCNWYGCNCYFEKSEHKNESGTYITHFYNGSTFSAGIDWTMP